MNSRVSLSKKNAKAYGQLIDMSNNIDEQAILAGLEEGFVHLLKLRLSQINGCAFCVRLHSQDAQKCGVSIDKIALVATWKETEYFSEKEKSALSLAESVNLIHNEHVPDDIYQESAKYWDEAQLASIEWISIIIGAFNRVAIASRYSVKP
ncbi:MULTISPECIES: carboxymuconolactone decarboxylase family protein [Proteus]|uniref:carboxymuconolactone decarboxylase family protein n=1 Tax=Proteus TaxID=583 RepID=UPI000BFFCD3E|nr:MULTISPECIES: carboxymuconolactone decarboxylase family protein [Proteus]MDL2100414.1 carboxymuconolactone decarboxylase family protein [Proteus mirabilis]HEK2042230.1 carboxymuconolactone decarboxylase family protein [Proteus mirabilis]HEK2082202.1 carboxymuconolactone decarboxylase family protein [Proteus mirabilis]